MNQAAHETLLQALPVGVILVDQDGRVVLYNEAESRLSGLRRDEVEGRLLAQVPPYADHPELAAGVCEALEASEAADIEQDLSFVVLHRTLEVRVLIRRVDLAGRPHAILVVNDDTSFKSAQRATLKALDEARDEAIRDPLTGLFNRRYLESILPSELARAQRHGVALSLLVVDVDHFKAVNDRFGHPVGDRVLIRLASLMRRMRRVSDTCARLGGEEFCVLLPHTPARLAAVAADRLLRVVRALRFEEEPDLRITISVGVAAAPSAGGTADVEAEVRALMARADEALYEAKRAGRDRSVVKE